MKKIGLCAILLLQMCVVSYAHEMPEEFLERLPFDAGSGGFDDIERSLEKLANDIKYKMTYKLREGIQKGVLIIFVCGACTVAEVFKKCDEDTHGRQIVEVTGVCLLLMITLGDTESIIAESRKAIEEIEVFSKILFPLMAMWAGYSGKPLSSVAITGGAMAYTNVCCVLAEKLIFALIITYILLKVIGMACRNDISEGIADGMKKALFFIVKLSLTGISLYMTLSGCIMSAGDSASVKAVKAAVSVLPGIGSAVAGTTESVMAGAAVIRNSLGVFGIVAVLFFVAAPIVSLFVNMIMFRLVGVIATAFSPGILSDAVDTLANGYSMAIGILAAASGGIIMSVAISVLVFGG